MTYFTWEEEKTRMSEIVGSSITAIYMGESALTFDTDKGRLSYGVWGDCCSTSFFFDFYGVKNLLENGPVVAFEEVELSPGDPGYLAATWESTDSPDEWEYIQVYGYRLTTEHPKFGPVSSVVSFRNSSNGYYGGGMSREQTTELESDQVLLTEDKVGS